MIPTLRPVCTGSPVGISGQPLRQHSRATIQAVLDTAAELVVELGAEAVAASPAVLLARCGVSPRSFYSFFDTPQQVLDKLALQCMQDTAGFVDKALRACGREHWTQLVGALIDCYTNAFRDPLVREVWMHRQLSSSVRALSRAWIDDVAVWVQEELQSHAPHFAGVTHIQCVVALETLERLIHVAFLDDPRGDPAIIEEARSVVIHYWSRFAEN